MSRCTLGVRACGSHCPPAATELGTCPLMAQMAEEKAEPPRKVCFSALNAASWSLHFMQKFWEQLCKKIKTDVLWSRMQTLIVR